MPTKDPKKRTETPAKTPEAPRKNSGEKPETRPAKEPLPPKKKGEVPPDIAEPVVGEADGRESE